MLCADHPNLGAASFSAPPPGPRPSVMARNTYRAAGCIIVLLCVGGCTSACISVRGQLFPAWKPSSIVVSCTTDASEPIGPSFRASVTDLGGQPLPGIPLTLLPVDLPLLLNVASGTRGDGTATFQLQPGLWRLSIRHAGFKSLSTLVNLPAAQACLARILLAPNSRESIEVH